MKRTTKSVTRCAALAVLVGSLWAVTMGPGRELSLLRQDISAMITLHRLHATYPEATQFHLEYLDDGWLSINAILPHELEARSIAERIELRSACNDLLARAESSHEQTEGESLPLNDDPARGGGSPFELPDK